MLSMKAHREITSARFKSRHNRKSQTENNGQPGQILSIFWPEKAKMK